MTKDNEWGNIELPGLSDDKLYTTNWNMVAHAQTKRDNPEFSQRMRKVAEARDAEYYLRQRAGCLQRDNTYQQECNQRPEVRAKISESMKQHEKTQEHKDKVAEQNRLRSKTIQTPFGIFGSRKLAVEYMLANNIGNASRKLDKWLKTKPAEYYYLDK
jgi:hypothetical protein